MGEWVTPKSQYIVSFRLPVPLDVQSLFSWPHPISWHMTDGQMDGKDFQITRFHIVGCWIGIPQGLG